MVASYVQLIEKKYGNVIDDDGREYMNFAVQGVNRLKILLDCLLIYSRLNSDNTEYETADTGKIVLRNQEKISRGYPETLIKFENGIMPELTCNKDQVNELFFQLYSNCVKFNSNNHKIIKTDCIDKTNEYIFKISDNGIGIPIEYQDKVFGIFQRLHTAEEYPGTGIGLTLCKRIVELHSGEIWFESNNNEGTTFYFKIPKK